MFLRVASHSILEGSSWNLDDRSVPEMSVIKLVYLFYEFRSMSRPVSRRLETGILLGFVTTKYQQVVYAQKLKVKQHIFQVLSIVSATHDMRYYM